MVRFAKWYTRCLLVQPHSSFRNDFIKVIMAFKKITKVCNFTKEKNVRYAITEFIITKKG